MSANQTEASPTTEQPPTTEQVEIPTLLPKEVLEELAESQPNQAGRPRDENGRFIKSDQKEQQEESEPEGGSEDLPFLPETFKIGEDSYDKADVLEALAAKKLAPEGIGIGDLAEFGARMLHLVSTPEGIAEVERYLSQQKGEISGGTPAGGSSVFVMELPDPDGAVENEQALLANQKVIMDTLQELQKIVKEASSVSNTAKKELLGIAEGLVKENGMLSESVKAQVAIKHELGIDLTPAQIAQAVERFGGKLNPVEAVAVVYRDAIRKGRQERPVKKTAAEELPATQMREVTITPDDSVAEIAAKASQAGLLKDYVPPWQRKKT